MSKLDAARNAAAQAQTPITAAESAVASAETALATARQRLENAQRKHQEWLAAVRAEEAASAAPATKAADAAVSDITAKSHRVVSWIDSITGSD